jgi:hypothetical protein
MEDRIKDLCAKAVETPASPQLGKIFRQLQSALSEHTQRMRKMARLSLPSQRDDSSIETNDQAFG